MRELVCDDCGNRWEGFPGLTHCPRCLVPLRRAGFWDDPPPGAGFWGGLILAAALAGAVALVAWWAFR